MPILSEKQLCDNDLLDTMVNQDFKSLIISKYESGCSAKEVAKEMGFSENKVNYWLNKLGIKKRSISDAIYLKANRDGDPFKVDLNVEINNPILYGLGVGLYSGEGEKVSRHHVRVANGDFRVILSFRRFLREVCKLREEKIRYSIVCFNDSNTAEVERYWLKKLELKGKVFGKIVQVPSQGRGTYRRKSVNGVCTITVSNVKLKSWIMEQINKVLGMPG